MRKIIGTIFGSLGRSWPSLIAIAGATYYLDGRLSRVEEISYSADQTAAYLSSATTAIRADVERMKNTVDDIDTTTADTSRQMHALRLAEIYGRAGR